MPEVWSTSGMRSASLACSLGEKSVHSGDNRKLLHVLPFRRAVPKSHTHPSREGTSVQGRKQEKFIGLIVQYAHTHTHTHRVFMEKVC